MNDDTFFKQVRDKMNLAVEDADSLAPTFTRAGCVFYAVRVPWDDDVNDEEFELSIRRQLDRYRRALEPCADAYAWCFPKVNRSFFSEVDNDYFPGVITAIKLLD